MTLAEDAVQTKHAARLSDAITAGVKAMRESLDVEALRAAIKARDKRAVLAALDFKTGWADIYEGIVSGALVAAAKAALGTKMATATADAGGDLIETQRAVKAKPGAFIERWADQHVAAELDRTTKAGIASLRQAINDALDAGEDPDVDDLAEMLKAKIGLTNSQAVALEQYKEDLLDEGDYTPKEIRALVAERSDELLSRRADTIAYNEVSRAMSASQLQAWETLKEEGVIDETWQREWVVTSGERACDICVPLHGTRVGLGEEFAAGIEMPPDPHIGCECEVILIDPQDMEQNALARERAEAHGDFVNHPFRGNQYTVSGSSEYKDNVKRTYRGESDGSPEDPPRIRLKDVSPSKSYRLMVPDGPNPTFELEFFDQPKPTYTVRDRRQKVEQPQGGVMIAKKVFASKDLDAARHEMRKLAYARMIEDGEWSEDFVMKLKAQPNKEKHGDLPGHEFRGNQWTSGRGGGAGARSSQDREAGTNRASWSDAKVETESRYAEIPPKALIGTMEDGTIPPIAKGGVLSATCSMDDIPPEKAVAVLQVLKDKFETDPEQIETNFRTLFERGMANPEVAAEKDWYFKRHDEIKAFANEHGARFDVAVAVSSAMSPGIEDELALDKVSVVLSAAKKLVDPKAKIGRVSPEIRSALEAGTLTYETLMKAAPLVGAKAFVAQYKKETKQGWAVGNSYEGITSALKVATGASSISDALGGIKTRSFYNNILKPDTNHDVTNDIWQCRAALGGLEGTAEKVVGWEKGGKPRYAAAEILKSPTLTKTAAGVDGGALALGAHPIMSDIVRKMAAERGMLPHQVQAVIWKQIRDNEPGWKKPDVAKRTKALIKARAISIGMKEKGPLLERKVTGMLKRANAGKDPLRVKSRSKFAKANDELAVMKFGFEWPEWADAFFEAETQIEEDLVLYDALRDMGYEPEDGIDPDIEAARETHGDLPGHPFRGNQYTDGFGDEDEKRIAPGDPRRNENFKKWFKDSKIVDAEGKPRVVYHGTDASFDSFKVSPEGKHGAGIYLSFSPKDASEYAETRKIRMESRGEKGGNAEANVVPLFVAMSNPFMLSSKNRGLDTGGKTLAEYAQEHGHDGIIDESFGYIVAFKPQQIKSATGNRGTFSPRAKKITHSEAHGDFVNHPFRGNQWTRGADSQISFEAQPTTSKPVLPGLHSASYPEKARYLRDAVNAIKPEKIADMMDLHGVMVERAGYWQDPVLGTVSSPSMQFMVDDDGTPEMQDKIEAYAAVIGILFEQDGVGYSRVVPAANARDCNSADLTFDPKHITSDNIAALDRALRDEGEDSFALVATKDGVRVLNFNDIEGDSGIEFNRRVMRAATKGLPDDVTFEQTAIKTIGDMPSNDWGKNNNGEGYVSRLSAERRLQVERTVARLSPEQEALKRKWSALFGSSR